MSQCRRVAKSWRRCGAWAKEVPHRVDSIASLHGNFLYVNNPKAGSTNVRELLQNVLNRTWLQTDLLPPSSTNVPWQARGCGNSRLTSQTFPSLASLYNFSVVRDPVAKFESGVRQLLADARFGNLTADEILELQLANAGGLLDLNQTCHGKWLEEHLQPSSWRLSTRTRDLGLVDFGCIAKVETFEDDWDEIVGSMKRLTVAESGALRTIGHANAREHDSRSKLSPRGIRRMCESWVYRHEWECFGYPLPEECAGLAEECAGLA